MMKSVVKEKVKNSDGGKVNFYGRDFLVSKNVLIPRPETELMIDATLNLAGKSYLPGVKPAKRRLPVNPAILDVGTGSGCIAITLKLELPEATVYAVDLSKKALVVAVQNAKLYKADVVFGRSDLLSEIEVCPDVIVANLPYVDKEWDWLDLQVLAAEPAEALFAEDGGLALIKKLIVQSSKRKVVYLILEADPCQHERIVDFAALNHYKLLEIRGYSMVFGYQK